MHSALSHLECSKCEARSQADTRAQLCECGGPLLARYDMARAAQTFTIAQLRAREPTLWRYAELLPLADEQYRVTLHEAMTPILPLSRVGPRVGLERLFLKDEGQLPSGTFKARGAAVGLSRAKELGVEAFVMPTNGNAGGAWSAYAARAGMKACIIMPQRAPRVNRAECVLAGAALWLVDGTISDAGRIATEMASRNGLYDASTLKEPYRIEGKKTLGFELVEQFEWHTPDVIVYPTGGGVGLIGIYKALRELQALGMIEARMPRMVAVQAAGCAPIVRAWQATQTSSEFWNNARTVAFGISVPKALGDFLVLDAIYQTRGAAVAVTDERLLEMQALLASCEGALVCPEGGATLAAAIELRNLGWIAPHERVLLINTGSGLKYPDVPFPDPPLLQPGESPALVS